MKNIITIAILALSLISLDVFAQLKVVNSGWVGVGTNAPQERLHVNGGLMLTGGYRNFRFLPNNPGPEIGSSYGEIIFWYSGTGYNKLVAKKFIKSSDLALKENVQPLDGSLGSVLELEGVSYTFKTIDSTAVDSTLEFGFIAQDVQTVAPNLVSVTTKGHLAVDYDGFIPLLVEGMKEQQAMIDSLQAQLDNLKTDMDLCCAAGKSNSTGSGTTTFGGDASLEQNKPNPFSEQTTIGYTLPKGAKGQIVFFDMNGSLLRDYSLDGSGALVINGASFEAGMYLYSLLVNGEEVDTKRMILLESK